MRFVSITLALTVATLAGVRAQSAAINLVGTGCTTNEGVPRIGHIGLPVLGQSFELTYTGPNHQAVRTQDSTQPFLVIGFTPLTPVDIPTWLMPAQPAGCTLWSTHEVVVAMPADPLVRGRYADSMTLPVGRDPGLLGLPFFAQWLAVHMQCGFAGCSFDWIGTSGAALCTIGT